MEEYLYLSPALPAFALTFHLPTPPSLSLSALSAYLACLSIELRVYLCIRLQRLRLGAPASPPAVLPASSMARLGIARRRVARQAQQQPARHDQPRHVLDVHRAHLQGHRARERATGS